VLLFLDVIYFSPWHKKSDFLSIKLIASNGLPEKCFARKLTACIINEVSASASLFIQNIHINKAINREESIKVNVLKYFSPEGQNCKNIVAFHKFF